MVKDAKLKRCLDVMIATIAVLVLLPLWTIIAICILLENPGPVLFKQKRPGLRGELFTLYKFRSMTVNNIDPLTLGAVKHAHPLVTKVGYLLRRTKLDETPQFFNVLFGQMSLVGPRPCLMERIKTMSVQEKNRFNFPPGMTGWAEVNGNVELTWEEQLYLDLWYVKHQSFKLDLIILFKTLKVVLFGSKRNEQALLLAKNDI